MRRLVVVVEHREQERGRLERGIALPRRVGVALDVGHVLLADRRNKPRIPPLAFERGKTYRINNDVSASHPLYIKSLLGPGSTGEYNDGVSGNGASVILFTVPLDAPDALYYQCANHFAQSGVIEGTGGPPAVPGLSNIGQMMLVLALMAGVALGTFFRRAITFGT